MWEEIDKSTTTVENLISLSQTVINKTIKIEQK